MNPMDLKPNSHKYREKQADLVRKKNESVVKGGVKTRKNGVRKFAETFISDDAKDIKSYILYDVVIPTIKNTFLTSLDMLLNGGRGSYNNRSHTSKVSYRRYYDDPRDNKTRPDSGRPRSRFDYDDIEFDHRSDAEAVLEQMIDTIEEYKIVTVQDMYEFAELSAPFTSNKFGWTNLSSAYVTSLMGGGYVIKLPKAMPID